MNGEVITKQPTSAAFAVNQHTNNPNELEPRINICQTTLNNVVYLSDGFNEVMKYDGDRLYRAGLPSIPRDSDDSLAFTSSDITSPNGATGGGMTDGTRTYELQFEYTDDKGNIITSTTSAPIEITNSSGTSTNKNIISWNKYYQQFSGTAASLDDRFQGFDKDGLFGSGFLNGTDATYQAFSQARKNRTKLAGEKRLRVKIWRTRDHATGAPGQFLLLADKEFDVSGRQFADTTDDNDLNSEVELPLY